MRAFRVGPVTLGRRTSVINLPRLDRGIVQGILRGAVPAQAAWTKFTPAKAGAVP